MTRVAPFAQQNLVMYNTFQTQKRVYEGSLQVATGQKAQTYSGIAQQASRLLSAESAMSRSSQYLQSITTAERRIELIDANLEGIETIAKELRDVLETAQNGAVGNFVDAKAYATNARTLLLEHLNARDGDRWLFAGNRVDRQAATISPPGYTPVSLIEADANTVDDTFYAQYRDEVLGTPGYPQGSFYAQIYFDKNGVAPVGPLPADPANPTLGEFTAEDPDLWDYYVSRMSSSEMLANPKLDYYRGDAGVASVRISETTTVRYGMNAGEEALQQLMIGLDAIANLPDTAPSESALSALFNQVRDMLSPVIEPDPTTTYESITELRNRVLGPLALLDSTRESHNHFITYAQEIIDDAEGINDAEVIARLQSNKVALEASFASVSQLQSLSLVNYLK